MTLADLRAAVRRKLDDVATPYGWSDADLNAWINEAVREASLRASLTPVATTVAVVAGTASHALDAAIVYVHRVQLASTSTLLTRTTRTDLDGQYYSWEDTTGTPSHFFIEARTLTLYPNPVANDTLALRAEQYPAELTADTDSPGIDAHDHLPLLEWVLYRAGQQRDTDFTLPDAGRHEENFTRYFGPRPSTKLRRGWLEWGGTSTARSS